MLEQSNLPLSFLQCLSFKKEKLGMEILTLARRINHLLYSIQQLSKSHEKYRPKRIQELFFLFVIFFFLPCVHTCVCVLEITKETGMSKIRRNSSKVHPQFYSF